MTLRWWETPCSSISVDTDPDHSDWPRRIALYKSSLSTNDWRTYVADYGFPVFDYAAKTSDPTTRGRTGWNGGPLASHVPWRSSWTTQVSTGNDHAAIVYDSSTGYQWGYWGVAQPGVDGDGELFFMGGTNPGTLFGTYTLLVGAAYQIKDPLGNLVDMRTYMGNYPWALGSGTIPHIITQAELDAGSIQHVLSAYMWNGLAGTESESIYSLSPCGKHERTGSPPSVGAYGGDFNTDLAVPEGVRFGLDPNICTDSWIDTWADTLQATFSLTTAQKTNAITIAKAVRDYGIIYALSSDNAGIACQSNVTNVSVHSIKNLLTEDNIVVYEAPYSTLIDESTTQRSGHSSNIQYSEAAPTTTRIGEGITVSGLILVGN
jgi:hypothetical protein